jgi:hypothetical protein
MSDFIKFTNRIWISPVGEIVEMVTGDQHSNYAGRYYAGKGIVLTPFEAMERFLNEGWIRVQSDGNRVSLEGIELALSSRGDFVFRLVPNFKQLVLMFFDTGKFKLVPREQVEGWSWDSIVKEARKGLIAFGE